MNSSQVTKKPFRHGARHREAPIGTIAYESGAEKSLKLKNVGFVNHLVCHLEADYTVSSTAPTVHEDGLFNLIKSVEVQINISAANPVKLSGYALKLLNTVDRYGFRPDLAGVGKVTPQSSLYAVPIATSGTNKWRLSFIVPIGLNTHREADIGCLPMFARGLQADFVVNWNPLTSVVSGGTSPAIANCKMYVEQSYFEMPDPAKVAMPSFFVVKRVSQVQGSVLAGDNIVNIPQEGRLLALGHVLRVNGSRDDNIDEHRITINENDTPIRQTLRTNRLKNRRELGVDMETGTILQNFMAADNHTFSGSAHESFDAGRIATLDSILVVNSAASLSSNPSLNSIETIRTLIQPLVVPSDMV